MRRLPLYVFLAIALCAGSVANAQSRASDGAWLFKGIEATERIVRNAPQGNDQIAATELRFYIEGLLAMNRYADTLSGPHTALLNSGGDKTHNDRMRRMVFLYTPLKRMTALTYGQALTVIKKHILANPSDMKIDAVLVVIDAFE